jgi:hypothetical protein
MSLHVSFLPGAIPYTGSELAPHWISARTKVFQSSIVAFRGPCRVDTGEMVDLEDSRAHRFIESKEMLHFLGEWFDGSLELAVARQRLLIAGFSEILRAKLPPATAQSVKRRGNDLFIGDGKLSVSIVTASPISTLFHFGVNIDPSGAPVRATGLVEFGLSPEDMAKDALRLWTEEWDGMAKARCKVAPR